MLNTTIHFLALSLSSSPIIIILTVLFIITSSLTTFDKRLAQARKPGVLPSDEPLLPSWIAFVYWVHMGTIIALLIYNFRYALLILLVGFFLSVMPVWETLGNIMMSPFKPKN